jgi:hypothetical protein
MQDENTVISIADKRKKRNRIMLKIYSKIMLSNQHVLLLGIANFASKEIIHGNS